MASQNFYSEIYLGEVYGNARQRVRPRSKLMDLIDIRVKVDRGDIEIPEECLDDYVSQDVWLDHFDQVLELEHFRFPNNSDLNEWLKEQAGYKNAYNVSAYRMKKDKEIRVPGKLDRPLLEIINAHEQGDEPEILRSVREKRARYEDFYGPIQAFIKKHHVMYSVDVTLTLDEILDLPKGTMREIYTEKTRSHYTKDISTYRRFLNVMEGSYLEQIMRERGRLRQGVHISRFRNVAMKGADRFRFLTPRTFARFVYDRMEKKWNRKAISLFLSPSMAWAPHDVFEEMQKYLDLPEDTRWQGLDKMYDRQKDNALFERLYSMIDERYSLKPNASRMFSRLAGYDVNKVPNKLTAGQKDMIYPIAYNMAHALVDGDPKKVKLDHIKEKAEEMYARSEVDDWKDFIRSAYGYDSSRDYRRNEIVLVPEGSYSFGRGKLDLAEPFFGVVTNQSKGRLKIMLKPNNRKITLEHQPT